jgi:hypothetical protein
VPESIDCVSSNGSVSGSTPSVMLADRLPVTSQSAEQRPEQEQRQHAELADPASSSHLWALSQPCSAIAVLPGKLVHGRGF